MMLKTVKKTTLIACVLLAVVALAGCKNKQEAAGGFSSKSTPAQVNQAVQEQAAKRAEYYKNQSGARR